MLAGIRLHTGIRLRCAVLQKLLRHRLQVGRRNKGAIDMLQPPRARGSLRARFTLSLRHTLRGQRSNACNREQEDTKEKRRATTEPIFTKLKRTKLNGEKFKATKP